MSSLRITLTTAKLQELLRPRLRAVNEVFAEQARRTVPVDSGELRDSVFATETGFGATADYAAHVELGTRTTEAQPFLRPALDDARDAALAQLRNSL